MEDTGICENAQDDALDAIRTETETSRNNRQPLIRCVRHFHSPFTTPARMDS